MNAATPLAHTAFMTLLKEFAANGATHNERALARVALGIYERSCESPRVVNYVNEWTLQVLS